MGRTAELGRPELAGLPVRPAVVEVGVVIYRSDGALTVPHVLARLRERGVELPEAEVREALERLVATGKILRVGTKYRPTTSRYEWPEWPD